MVVVGQLVGMSRRQRGRFVGLAEAAVVELAEVRRLEDRVVDIAIGEQVFHQPLATLVEVLLVAPQLGFGRQIAVIVVEAVDELLAVDVALILRTGVPESDVGIDDEVLLAILLVHGVLRYQVVGEWAVLRMGGFIRRPSGRSRCTLPRPRGWRTASCGHRNAPSARSGWT